MDYEKAYNEALERAKMILCNIPEGSASVRDIETIFPELRESEDEIIRKEMIDFLKSEKAFQTIDLPISERWIAYLEKQKEQKHTLNWRTIEQATTKRTDEGDCVTTERMLIKGLIDDEDYRFIDKNVIVNKNLLCIPVSELNAKEQKPVEEQFPPLKGLDAIKAEYYDKGFKNGFDEGVDSVKPVEWSANDKAFIKDCARILDKNGYAASAKRLLSMFPVEPAEWSEEDTQMLARIIERGQSQIQMFETGLLPEHINWLKSLRPQPKQKWTEEEKDNVIKYLHEKDGGMLWSKATEITEEILEILHPKPHWKPSDEQMKALKRCVDGWPDTAGSELDSLYNDLKKLCS